MKFNASEIIVNPCEKIYTISDENYLSRIFALSFLYGLLAISLWQLGAMIVFRQGFSFFLAHTLLFGSGWLFFTIFYIPAASVLSIPRGADCSLLDIRRLVVCANFSATILFSVMPISLLLRYAFPHSSEAIGIFILLSLCALFFVLVHMVGALNRRYLKNTLRSILAIVILPLLILLLFFITGGTFVRVLCQY